MVRLNNIITLVVFLIILCAVLAVCLLSKTNVEITRLSRHYPNKTLVYDEYSFKDDKFVYLTCNQSKPLKCKVVQEKYPYKKGFKSCNVSLDIEGEINQQSIFVVAFGENKAILLWQSDNNSTNNSSESYVKISVVHLDVCEQKDIKKHYSFTIEQLANTNKILTYLLSFDVLFKNYALCGNQECRKQFDQNGDEINSFDKLIINDNYNISNVYSINSCSNNCSYVYTKSHYNKTIAYLIHPNGTEKYLKLLPGVIKISVVNGSIGVCSRVSINTTCFQYNSNGELKMNVTLTDVNNVTRLQSIYAIPEGGLLLSFTDFGRCQEDICDQSLLSNYFIQKIDEIGKPIGKLRFQGLHKDYKGLKHSHIWLKQKKKQYCAFIVPFGKQIDKIELFVNCFPTTNFVE